MKNKWLIKIKMIAVFTVLSLFCFGQTPTDSLPGDPANLSVYTIQNISFGAFSHGSTGGTISIANNGTRTSTGDVIALNLGISYYNSIFEIESPAGTIISILNGPDATLTGSNGGSMSLHIGSSNPGSPFNNVVGPPGRTQINVGGTLTVGGAATAPPGSYTGTIYITFNQE